MISITLVIVIFTSREKLPAGPLVCSSPKVADGTLASLRRESSARRKQPSARHRPLHLRDHFNLRRSAVDHDAALYGAILC
jgi:hypothetical protein